MKIIKSGLHPLYDQYSNQENRLTHALLHTVSSSEWLLSRFLKQIVGVDMPIGRETLEISSQKVPFAHGDDDARAIMTTPDGWIVTEGTKLGVAIEVKDMKDVVRIQQLEGHSSRVTGYDYPYLLVITPDLTKHRKIDKFQRKRKDVKVIWHSWDEIYRWLKKLSISMKFKRSKEAFLVASLQEYLERRREVLGFQGINFSKGFNVVEAKDILNAEMEEIDESAIKKVNYKKLCERRPAITTFSQESVWDCFGSEDGFTKDLHITFSINEKAHDISITVPNSARQAWSRLRKVFSNDVEKDRLFSILESLRNKVPHLFIEFNQRHFIARKKGIRDGYMEFDIDTLGSPFMKKNSKAKKFPMWWSSIEEAIVNKKLINGQVMFKARFYFDETKGIEKPNFIKTAENTIEALKPLYDFLKEN